VPVRRERRKPRTGERMVRRVQPDLPCRQAANTTVEPGQLSGRFHRSRSPGAPYDREAHITGRSSTQPQNYTEAVSVVARSFLHEETRSARWSNSWARARAILG
jgi:hypothetical protein